VARNLASTSWPGTPLTPLIGREEGVADVVRLLASCRLVTLVGVGGVGKTRLAIEVAARISDRSHRDVAFVDLARVADSSFVGSAVLAALGANEQSGRDPLDTAAALVDRRDATLVIDNCEHVLDGAAAAVELLLQRCPRLRIVATSRETLRLGSETVWRTPTLSLPDPAATDETGALCTSGAGALFLAVAARRRPGFTPSVGDANVIARICADLDGLPLALELAAARVTMLSPSQIAAGLSSRFQLLTTGARTAPSRHRSLRASLDWSHDLLLAPERILLRRLSVFRGGWTLASARAVCARGPVAVDGVLDLTGALIDKSLVTVTDTQNGMRYGLHESVREYAAEQLLAAGEQRAIQSAWLAHFAAVARAADEMLNDGDGRAALAADEANLRAALAAACESDPLVALGMTVGLARSWLLLDRHREGVATCARVLEVAADGDPAQRAAVHWVAGQLAVFGQDYASAFAYAAEGIALAETSGDASVLGLCLELMSSIVNWSDPIEGARLAARAVELVRAGGTEYALGLTLANLTFIEGMRDRFNEAASAYREFSALPTAGRDPWLNSLAEAAMAWTEVGHGDPRAAVDHADRALGIGSDDDSMLRFIIGSFRARALATLGRACEAHDDLTGALARARRRDLSVAVPTLEVALLVAELALGNFPSARALAERLCDEPALHTAAVAHDALARLALVDDDADAAREHARALAEVARCTASPRQQALAEQAFGAAALCGGDHDEARHHLHNALALQDGNDLRGDLPDTLEALGNLALQCGDGRAAARLLGAAVGARRAFGCPAIPPADDRMHASRRVGCQLLGDEDWSERFRRAEEQPLADAVLFARRGRGARQRPRAGWASLTPTEGEVVELIGGGLTNAQIGEQLSMSRSTVKAHLSRAYTKLGIGTRAELAAAVARRPESP
jgi:predicted ATPase/DNA-binding CsgD family transcriptional regulator